MKKKYFLLTPILFIGIAICFLARSVLLLDPDFGWRILVGNFILSHGIPVTDPLSYTMPSYPFIDYEWLTHVIMSVLFSVVGYGGLAVLFAGIGIAAMSIQLVRYGTRWTGLPLLLAGCALFPFMGIRPQVLSWLFFALLFQVLFYRSVWKKWRFGLPFLFLFWANMHAAFVAGIAVFGLWFVTTVWQEKRLRKGDLLVLLLSCVATLVTPFGSGLWQSIVLHVSDPQVSATLQEWYPALYVQDLPLWVYSFFSIFFIIKYYRKFSVSEIAVVSVLFIAGVISMRHMPIWVIASLPFFARSLMYLSKETARYPLGAWRFARAYLFLVGLMLILCLPHLWYTIVNAKDFSEQAFYPYTMVGYLKTHVPRGEVFAPYEWNGYVGWKLPEKKVFVNGLMPSWHWQPSNGRESSDAYGEYRDVLSGKKAFKEIAKKYRISTVIVPPDKKPKTSFYGGRIQASIGKLLGLQQKEHSAFALLVPQVKKMGWVVVYRDKTGAIYQNVALERKE